MRGKTNTDAGRPIKGVCSSGGQESQPPPNNRQAKRIHTHAKFRTPFEMRMRKQGDVTLQGNTILPLFPGLYAQFMNQIWIGYGGTFGHQGLPDDAPTAVVDNHVLPASSSSVIDGTSADRWNPGGGFPVPSVFLSSAELGGLSVLKLMSKSYNEWDCKRTVSLP